MRAVVQTVYGPVENLRLAEIDKPVTGANTVLVRVRAAAVDPSVWHMATGLPLLARPFIGLTKPKQPVAGWDAAGVVEAVGAGVTAFEVGDSVFGACDFELSGSFAEWTLLPLARCARKPANLSFEEAAAFPVSGCTALQAVRDAGRVATGTSVLVIGAGGGVGHFAVQLAKAFGATVTGVCSTGKVAFVRSLGADDVIDYTAETIRASGRQWDVIVDAGGLRSFADLRGVLAPKGRLAFVGGEGGNAWTGGYVERMLGAAALSLVSSQKLVVVAAAVNPSDLQVLTELAEAGRVRPTIDQRVPLEEAVAALHHLARGHTRGKNVVVIGSPTA